MDVISFRAEGLAGVAFQHPTLGQIPEDWIVRALENLTDSKRPISYGIVQTGPSVHGGIRCLRVVDIDHGRIDASNMITTTETISAAYTRTVLQAGDLVMPLRGKVGEVAIVGIELAGSNLTRGVALIAIRPANCAPFIKHFVASDFTRTRLAQLMNGSALQEIPISALRSFEIALPPTLTEQGAIAEVLGETDTLIESLEQLLAKKRQIKQGAMQELLTGQRRLPGFDAMWDERPFEGVLARVGSKACQIEAGEYQRFGRYPVVDQGQQTVVAFSDRSDRLLRCPLGGLIVFGDHTCIVKFVAFDFIVGADGTQVLRAQHGQCAQFHAFQLQLKGVESTGYNRHFKALRERTFAVPALSEQTAIAITLSDMDAELTALEARLAKTRQIKQGMMQALLTGRIRLVPPQEEQG